MARGFNPSRFAVATARSQLAGSRLNVSGVNIGDDRGGAEQRHHFRRGVIGKGRTDHRIAASDPPCHQHEKQRVGAAGAADGVPRAAEAGEFAFKRRDFGPLDELAMRQDARHRVVDGAAEPAPLRRDVNERDRFFVNAGVLIYDRC